MEMGGRKGRRTDGTEDRLILNVDSVNTVVFAERPKKRGGLNVVVVVVYYS